MSHIQREYAVIIGLIGKLNSKDIQIYSYEDNQLVPYNTANYHVCKDYMYQYNLPNGSSRIIAKWSIKSLKTR
jgi:hypothetical protein